MTNKLVATTKLALPVRQLFSATFATTLTATLSIAKPRQMNPTILWILAY